MLLSVAPPATAETIRIATYRTELSRKGPGLMLRDILRREAQPVATARIIVHMAPDVILLQGIDYDHDQHGLRALRDLIAEYGLHYPYLFSRLPNSGMATGLDMDGDGRRGGRSDAQGFGAFAGQKGMGILSRFPIAEAEIRDFSQMLWKDMPDAQLPNRQGAPFPSVEAQNLQRLSYVGHWQVPLRLPSGDRLDLLCFHAVPPVFDGPEDANGLRNAAEIRFWQQLMDGALGLPPLKERFVVAGVANLDPNRGAGRRDAIRALLKDSRLHDPVALQGLLTVDWDDPEPGDQRVSYLLPSVDFEIGKADVFWPAPEDPEAALLAHEGVEASRHRLVWIDLQF